MRAPQKSGEILAVPPLCEAASLARANAVHLSVADHGIAGRSWQEFREWCQSSIQQAAQEWMSSELGVTPPSFESSGLWFVTGHQPEFTHPGVWMKNVAVAKLAERSQGIALNLIVDNDTADHCYVSVPGGDFADPKLEAVPFDQDPSQQPWEELSVRDSETFEGFGDEVRSQMRGWGVEPVLPHVWPSAVERARAGKALVPTLAASRVALEREHGLAVYELPLSVIARTEPFAAFVFELCVRYRELSEIYNSAVERYRMTHQIRNNRHPVPNLERREDAWELPFWFWKSGDANRSKVFVRESDGVFVLLSADGEICRLASIDEAIEKLPSLKGQLRTRALTTTLFARLGFADLFVHGIGGAKYDEITDAIIDQLFGIRPPVYLTLTATWHLPLGAAESPGSSVHSLEQNLRDLEYNPQHYVTSPEMDQLLEQKQTLIEEAQKGRRSELSRRERRNQRPINRKRHQELKSLTAKMDALAESQRQALEQDLDSARQRERADRILKSREFPVMLFPESEIEAMLETVDLALICSQAASRPSVELPLSS